MGRSEGQVEEKLRTQSKHRKRIIHEEKQEGLGDKFQDLRGKFRERSTEGRRGHRLKIMRNLAHKRTHGGPGKSLITICSQS